MFKFALALALVAHVVVAEYQDYIHDQELITGHLDFERLVQIKRDNKDIAARCNLYNQELREMLGSLARNSLSAHGLFLRVANVIANKHAFGPGVEVEAELEECASHLLKRKGDSSYAPSKFAHPNMAGGVDESIVISRMDFNSLVAAENEANGKAPEERCSVLEEELREMLGDLAEGLPQDDLFNRVVCVLDRRSAHFTSSLKVWDHLSSCLGEREHLPDLSETCWPHA